MRVFVLGPGRTGSMTFARACSHFDGLSCGHETRSGVIGPERLDYPDDHIEADNRLTWFLGQLEKLYGDEPYFVRMRRDQDEVAQSYFRRWRTELLGEQVRKPKLLLNRARAALGGRRWPGTIVEAFGHTILTNPYALSDEDRMNACRMYVEAVDANLDVFLAKRPRVLDFRLAHAHSDFQRFATWIDATGNLDRAISEWDVRHNQSIDQ